MQSSASPDFRRVFFVFYFYFAVFLFPFTQRSQASRWVTLLGRGPCNDVLCAVAPNGALRARAISRLLRDRRSSHLQGRAIWASPLGLFLGSFYYVWVVWELPVGLSIFLVFFAGFLSFFLVLIFCLVFYFSVFPFCSCFLFPPFYLLNSHFF